MSLRLRLLAGLAALVAAGLAVFSSVTYFSVDHVLVDRLNGQLAATARALTGTNAARSIAGEAPPGQAPDGQAPDGQAADGQGAPDRQGPGGPTPFGGTGTQLGAGSLAQDQQMVRNAAGPDVFVEFVASSSAVVEQVTATSSPAGVAPALPAALVAAIAAPGDTTGGVHQVPEVVAVQTFRLPPAIGRGKLEAVAVALPPNGGAIVVAASLEAVSQTLGNLVAVELGVGLGVLAFTLALGLALARQAIRPLEEIAVTADAIAAGDLDRRVPAGQDRSEAGRVALALNAMMTRIQEAFARRDATETRLRAFVADASHELATPLTSIRGYAELFHRGLAQRPEDLAVALGRIEREAARMGVLVDDLLTLASFDEGRPLAHDPVDLRLIAGDSAQDLRAVDPERPVSLSAPQPVIVVGDEARLRQVAANLVSNARRHTPLGTPVTLRARVLGDRGLLEVADQGPGMTAEQCDRVFDRFYRVDKARSRAAGGAGLGLSIVASIAEAHGGSASVASAPGQGATFTVAIPLARPPAEVP